MMKVLLIFALACTLATCELHWKLKKHEQTQNNRILFKSQASVYGMIDQYTDSTNQYIETPLSDGTFTAKLAVSLFDNYIWVPAKGCVNTNTGSKNASTCGSNLYTCSAPNCAVEKTQTVDSLTSFYASANPVQISSLQMANDSLLVKGQTVSDVQVALVQNMTNKDSFVQDGVLGLGYGNSLVQALVDSGVIQRNEFSYYISDTESFLTFGIHDNYLSKFPVVDYAFDNGNLCPACPDQESTNKWSLLIADLQCTDTNTTMAGVLTSGTSRLVFDTTTYGYSFSESAYNATKTFFASHSGISSCKDKSGFIQCSCSGGLTSLPTLSLSFTGNAQAWSLTPDTYAEENTDGTCTIFFSSRDETQTQMDDHIFAGRLFTKFFFTSFDSTSNKIKVASAFQQPDTYLMTQSTIGVVLALGVLSILVILIVINSILKPAQVTHEIRQVVELQKQHTGYVYSGNKVEPMMTTQRNIQN